MRIIVQLKPDATQHRRTAVRSGGSKALPWLDRSLSPIHADTSDPSLASFFEVEATDRADADRLVKRLLNDPSVDAAYLKPDDEPSSM